MSIQDQKKLEKRARQRADKLWAHYNEHGKLLLDDFRRITGGQFSHVSDTFERYGIEIPPVYNSRKEIYKRKASALWDAVEQLKTDCLTIRQAARALNVRPSDVTGIEMKLEAAGLNLPKIINDGQSDTLPMVETSSAYGRPNGNCNPLYYPQGLQVLRTKPGPGPNQITYVLR